jgi:hypothetical protein
MTLKADPEKLKAWKQRSRKPMNRGKGMQNAHRRVLQKVGPKTAEWERVRRWLKIQFEKVGIRTCQLRLAGCSFDNYLGFAHPAKRRNLLEGEIYIVALLCNHCHGVIEVGPPEEMRRIVEKLFGLTGIQIPKGNPHDSK